MGREINQLLGRIFAQRRKDGRTELEAIETALRSALHQAGATGLTELLRFPAPPADQRTRPCSCGQTSHYGGLRSKPVLTVVGRVEVSRPYYLCPDCHGGQFSADAEPDIENTEFSPGVRRVQALVGQEAPFDHGREQMKVLARLAVTAKSVERTVEGIGADVAQREQKERQKALQLDLPVAGGEPLPKNAARLYLDSGLHVEYSTPECANPWDAVRYVEAGHRTMLELIQKFSKSRAREEEAGRYRVNVDYSGTGATWGFHESYLHRMPPAAA